MDTINQLGDRIQPILGRTRRQLRRRDRDRMDHSRLLGRGQRATQERELALIIADVRQSLPELSEGCHPETFGSGASASWRRAASAALAELGLPAVSLHALRHTHASQLIDLGMDVVTISRRLGHGSPTITLNVYAHRFRNKDEQAAQVIEAAFGRTLTE
jgi:integrase